MRCPCVQKQGISSKPWSRTDPMQIASICKRPTFDHTRSQHTCRFSTTFNINITHREAGQFICLLIGYRTDTLQAPAFTRDAVLDRQARTCTLLRACITTTRRMPTTPSEIQRRLARLPDLLRHLGIMAALLDPGTSQTDVIRPGSTTAKEGLRKSCEYPCCVQQEHY